MNDLKKILGSLNGDTIISDADIRSLCAEIESQRRTIDIGTGQLDLATKALKYLSDHATGQAVIDVCQTTLAQITYGTSPLERDQLRIAVEALVRIGVTTDCVVNAPEIAKRALRTLDEMEVA